MTIGRLDTTLTLLLRDPPAPLLAADVRAWWRAFRERWPGTSSPVDDAIAGGFAADRAGYAFVAGGQAGMRALVPSLSDDAIAAFCATEPGGNHPRAIETRLQPDGDGFALSGSKRWSTMAPVADVLLVAAVEGADGTGRKRFRLVRVPASSPGLTIASMPTAKFMPEVPHGALELEGVHVEPSALLPGDGYAEYVKPFRTVEDLHVHAALLGYLVGSARRHAFTDDVIEKLATSVVATHALARLDPAAAETHVALAGLVAQDSELIAEMTSSWARVSGDERDRWERDAGLFGGVASQARERRRQVAWETLRRSHDSRSAAAPPRRDERPGGMEGPSRPSI